MIKSGSAPRLSAVGSKIRSLFPFTWFFCLIVAVSAAVAAAPLPQQNPDEQYIHIMTLIDRGDALLKTAQTNAAMVKYKQAQRELVYFKATNPLFNPKIVAYRLKEVTDRIDTYTRPQIPEQAAPAAKPSEKPSAKVESEAPGSKAGGVKLIDAGAEPRRQLRFHLKAGDKQTMIMTIEMSIQQPGMGGGAGSQTTKIPAINIPMDVTIQNVAPNGDFTYQLVAEEAGIATEPGNALPPQVMQILKTQLAAIKGLTATGTMSNRGVSKKVDVTAPPTADPQTRQTLDQMKEGMSNIGSPLPEEAVGAGAKWELDRTIKSEGLNVDQKEGYELVSADGDHLNLKFTLAQKASNQKVQNAALGNIQMNLVDMTANGTGTSDADLSRFIPSTATIDTHMELNAELTLPGGKKQPFNQVRDTKLTMEAK